MATIKTTHSGAKNGGGHWGTRREAKTTIKRLGRRQAKQAIRKQTQWVESL